MLKPISPDSSIFYIGVDDTTIDLFENQYPVPHGVSYNAYAIRDEKTALLDTVDPRATEQWLEQAAEVAGRHGSGLSGDLPHGTGSRRAAFRLWRNAIRK